MKKMIPAVHFGTVTTPAVKKAATVNAATKEKSAMEDPGKAWQ